MSKYEVNNIAVETLLSNLREGSIAIPEIQRPFVWKASKVRDLLDSLYQGYPVGYLIVWGSENVRLKDGSLSRGKKILIDGQQRMTALAAAPNGQKIFDHRYNYASITIAFNPKEERFEVSNPALRKSPEWISDISVLFEPGFSSYKFVNDYSERNAFDPDEVNRVITKLLNITKERLGIIELPSELELDVVTEIFTRINSKGKPLTQADLAMSKIAANTEHDGSNLRKTIDYYCHLIRRPQDYENIENNDEAFSQSEFFAGIKWVKDHNSVYQPGYDDVIRVVFGYQFKRGRMSDFVALLSGRDFEKRTYEEEIVDDTFEKLRVGIVEFCNAHNFRSYSNRLHNIGAINSKFIGSRNTLSFGYMLFLLLKKMGVDSHLRDECVERWLVLSILTRRYSSSSETRMQEDINAFADADDPRKFIDKVEEGELSDAFWNYTFIDQLSTTRTATYYLFIMAQIRANDRGFLSTETVNSMLVNQGDIHHIFPRDYLRRNGYRREVDYNQISNKVMVQKEMNIKISNLAPKDYLAKFEHIERNYEENAIPPELETMDHTDYQEFLEQRKVLLSKKIREYYLSFKRS